MKISVNNPCPCGSGYKYKKCCQIYHKGANPKTSLDLMKSRYSAYVVGDFKYIIKTTHKDNPSYEKDLEKWESQIKDFCKDTEFKKLTIISYTDVSVEFIAEFKNSKLHEISQFEKVSESWLYKDGLIK